MTVAPNPRRVRVIEAIVPHCWAAVGLALLLILYPVVAGPVKGVLGVPASCTQAINEHLPEFLDGHHIIRRSWGRTLEGHYAAAVVVGSSDLDVGPTTVICHFRGTEYVFDRFDVYRGDKFNEFVAVSTSNLNPTAWRGKDK